MDHDSKTDSARVSPGAGNEVATAAENLAAENLLPLVYDELRRLAAIQLAKEGPGQTLQPTALVHEAYLKLLGREKREFADRHHFFLAAAEAMRLLLIDRARSKATGKRGGGMRRHDIHDCQLAAFPVPLDEILDVDQALQKLEQYHQQAATLVKLRYFVGLTAEESAALLQLSRRQVDRLWQLARTWLFRWIQEDGS